MAQGIVVLISGSGTNLQAIIDEVKAGNIQGEISAVISNRPGVKGLERAQQAGIPTEVLDHKGFPDRESFDQAMIQLIDQHEPKVIVLAGFMRILTTEFVNHYLGRLINIHPALLPKYKGLHTHQRALAAGDTDHGCTVHFVTPELDDGPNILQAQVPVLPEDDESSLSARVQQQEHIIYPLAVQWFMEQRIAMKDGNAWLDQQPLPESGHVVSH